MDTMLEERRLVLDWDVFDPIATGRMWLRWRRDWGIRVGDILQLRRHGGEELVRRRVTEVFLASEPEGFGCCLSLERLRDEPEA